MTASIVLKNNDIRLFAGSIYNHDYLWFSSNEFSKVSITSPILHNYALSYALSQYSYGLFWGSIPRYQQDLEQMPVYATPAINEYTKRTKFTFNALNDVTLRTDSGGKLNTPDLGKRVCLNPISEMDITQCFRFFVFSTHGIQPPSVVRLGKKGAALRILWRELQNTQAVFIEEPVMPSHPVNPLDTTGEIVEYEPIAIPPHLLFRKAKIKNDWFIIAGKDTILFPKLIRERC